jgi:hypothetical protein
MMADVRNEASLFFCTPQESGVPAREIQHFSSRQSLSPSLRLERIVDCNLRGLFPFWVHGAGIAEPQSYTLPITVPDNRAEFGRIALDDSEARFKTSMARNSRANLRGGRSQTKKQAGPCGPACCDSVTD